MYVEAVPVLAFNSIAKPSKLPQVESNVYKEYLASLTPDYELLGRIINCESGWNPLAKNKGSTASGMFQFIASTWNSWGKGDVFNPFDNIESGVRLYNARGTSPWLASKDCWDN